ncbi:YCF48-related protein [Ignavibacteria bacterium 4148-Me]|uniref:WD40/YVTN/BNR-like repeat-containing protein n=1 Tax=Rosettibacter primus TaxID=3111523 RepID=UPI00336BE599
MNSMNLIIALFILLFTNVYAQWEVQNSKVKVDLNDVCFVDTLYGWAVGDSSTIINTTDGGLNWYKQICPVENIKLRKLQFVSYYVGYILGSNGKILSTKDGGKTWIICESGLEEGFNLTDLSFVNEDEGWLTGYKTYFDHGIGLIIHTVDGGKSWNKQLEIKSYDQFSAKLFTAVKFQNNNTGWAFAGDYVDSFSETFVYKTSDGGTSWVNVGIVKATPLRILRIAGKDTLWGGGLKFVTSVDGGYNWNYFENEFGNASSLAPIDGLKGWVYFSNIFMQKKQVLYTTNAGKTWSEEFSLPDGFIVGMNYINGNLWVVGNNGLIMKKKSVITSINTKKPEISGEFKLNQNYPNPFNSRTAISYELANESDVELKIYDMMGRSIKTIRYCSQPVGAHTILWDGTNDIGHLVSSGVYIYNLISSSKTGKNFFSSSKMIFLK